MPAEAEVVLFAIQSAVRLGAAARQAYVDSTLARELVLPLPNFNPSPTVTAALMYFSQQREPYTTGPDRQRKLLIRALKRQRAADRAGRGRAQGFSHRGPVVELAAEGCRSRRGRFASDGRGPERVGYRTTVEPRLRADAVHAAATRRNVRQHRRGLFHARPRSDRREFEVRSRDRCVAERLRGHRLRYGASWRPASESCSSRRSKRSARTRASPPAILVFRS